MNHFSHLLKKSIKI